MITDKETAKAVADLLTEAFFKVDEAVGKAKKTCSEDEYKFVLKITGPIAGSILSAVEPIYEQHPELKPAGWDD
jgi:hypothetical protein